ncbi:MAG: 3-oxoacyl-[acyl-carrier-protein] synthase III C-terminal domain-containing protein, partial [Pseudomonadota bacterium]
AEIDATRFGAPNTLIEDNLGVLELRYSQESDKASDLAVAAAENALARCDIPLDHIDLIIYCGIEGDYVEPATAHEVQHRLGLTGECHDLSNACLGLMTGIRTANAYIAAGFVRYVLLCTADRPSAVSRKIIKNLRQSNDAALFHSHIGALTAGDSGAAILLGPAEPGRGFVGFHGASRGRHAQLCYYTNENGEIQGQMKMNQISARMVSMHKEVLPLLTQRLSWDVDDIDVFITHQIGKRPFEKVRELLGVSRAKMTQTYAELGNIATSTFAVNFAQALDSGLATQGSKIYALMAGSGLSVVHAAMRV